MIKSFIMKFNLIKSRKISLNQFLLMIFLIINKSISVVLKMFSILKKLIIKFLGIITLKVLIMKKLYKYLIKNIKKLMKIIKIF